MILWMSLVFAVGYLFIALEHLTHINKATVALLMAVLCWTMQYAGLSLSHQENFVFLCKSVSDISQVILFLLGALAVVETISAHDGFKIFSDFVQVTSKVKLLWILGALSFMLSAILDNLTTTIVMVSILQKMVRDREDRWIIGSGIVMAANAGGAWTPIGDVTTTMLWIGGQVSSGGIMKGLGFASLVTAVVSLGALSFLLKGDLSLPKTSSHALTHTPYRSLIFCLGVASLVFVPVFKVFTGLPPFMGILLALSVLWLITDLLYRNQQEKSHLRMQAVFAKIDLAGVLFFLGILLSVAALEAAQILEHLAHALSYYIHNLHWIAVAIGVVSAVIDNVPIVAATMSMYSLTDLPQDHSFWILTALSAGVGGSMLIIGSAAGVVFMGLEKVDFFWYLKKASFPAALGFIAGVITFLVT